MTVLKKEAPVVLARDEHEIISQLMYRQLM